MWRETASADAVSVNAVSGDRAARHPDPGGRPEPTGHRAPRHRLRQLRPNVPFALVLVVAAIGIERIAQYHWRQGATLIGAALVLGAALRALLPADQAGLIAVRGRAVDVLSYAALGGCVLFVALTIQGGPFG